MTIILDIPHPDDKDSMDSFQEIMEEMNNSMNKEIEDLAKQLDVTWGLASEIWYLRTRSRHSVETEDRMIKCYRETGRDNFRTTAGEEDEELTRLGY